jgi:hypothetical protein
LRILTSFHTHKPISYRFFKKGDRFEEICFLERAQSA